MINRRRLVLGTLMLVVLSGAAYLYSQSEWIVEERDTGFSSNAKRKPYLAAFKMLYSSGVKVHYLLGFSILGKTKTDDSRILKNDSIVLINAYRTLSPRRAKKLLSWVKEGGHLIFSTDNYLNTKDTQQRDYLLNTLGVRLKQDNNKNTKNTFKLAFKPTVDCEKDYNQKALVKLNKVDRPISVGFMSNQELLDPRKDANVYVIADKKIKLLQKGFGKGLITVMTTTRMWNNYQIGCNDQAYLLWHLVGNGDQVWMLENLNAPSLLELAWARQPLTIALLLSMLMLWLWKISARFSPIKQVNSENRRQIQEHLRAAGKFFWRHSETQVVIRGLIEGIRSRIKNKYSLMNIGDKEIAEIICNITSIDRNQIDDVLLVKNYTNDSEFINQVKYLKLIREKL